MIHYQCFLSFSPASLSPSKSDHNILTKSSFDSGISHDSQRVIGKWRSVKSNWKEATVETQEVIKLIHLV